MTETKPSVLKPPKTNKNSSLLLNTLSHELEVRLFKMFIDMFEAKSSYRLCSCEGKDRSITSGTIIYFETSYWFVNIKSGDISSIYGNWICGLFIILYWSEMFKYWLELSYLSVSLLSTADALNADVLVAGIPAGSFLKSEVTWLSEWRSWLRRHRALVWIFFYLTSSFTRLEASPVPSEKESSIMSSLLKSEFDYIFGIACIDIYMWLLFIGFLTLAFNYGSNKSESSFSSSWSNSTSSKSPDIMSNLLFYSFTLGF